MVEAVRRLRRRDGSCRKAVLQNSLNTLRSELATLRGQLAQLATLADHYHTTTEELRALLARRDRDLATLRARGRPTLARMDRSTQGARGS
jgi:ribosomal protein L29